MKLRILFMLLLVSPFICAKNLTIAITGDNPPFNSRIDNHNHFYGFDVELMDEICKRMAVKCEYVAMNLASIFTAINNNRVDLAIDSIIITPERQKFYLFSQPYLTSRVRFMVRQDSVIHSPENLKDKAIGLRLFNPYDEFLGKYFKNQINIKTYLTAPDVIEALSSDKVKAMLINNIAAEYWVANNSRELKLVGSPIPFGEGFGIIAKKGQEALILKINLIMQQMQADGTYKIIYSHYFSW